ncbi:MAG: extracellular solute-binding protein [Parvibaculaceae bacterium]
MPSSLIKAAMIGGVFLASSVGVAMSEENALNIASWGGTTSKATRTALAEPFSKEAGVQVTVVDVGGPYAAKVTTQVNAGALLWDMLDSVGVDDYTHLWKQDLLEPVPDDLRKEIEPLLVPGAVGEYGVREADAGVIIACREGIKCPANPEEFWNVKEFPGARAIVSVAAQILPFAVQAGGVPRDKVYPIDLDLAFKMLEQIAPNVTVWTSSGDQMVQLFRTKEVDMQIMWSNRAYIATRQGIPVQFSWDGGLIEPSYLTVLKGSKNKANAFKFIEYYAKNPDRQADRVKQVSLPAASKDLDKYLPPEIIPYLTTTHKNVMVYEDGEWGFQNKDEIQRRWSEFLAK